MFSADGEVLANQAGPPGGEKSWTADLLEEIDRALAASGPVGPRRRAMPAPRSHRGVGLRPDGGVSLAVYTRLMLLGLHPEGLGDIAIDSITLSGAEWATLAPVDLKLGAQWVVPEAIVRKFNCLLSPSTDQSAMPLPDEVTLARLTGTVQQVEGGIAYLTFKGQIAGVNSYRVEPHVGDKYRGDVKVRGVGTFGVKDRRMRSFTLLANGLFGADPPNKDSRPYGGVVEWDREPPVPVPRPAGTPDGRRGSGARRASAMRPGR